MPVVDDEPGIVDVVSMALRHHGFEVAAAGTGQRPCGGGQFPRRRLTPTRAAAAKFVACGKRHGYHLPAPHFSGNGPIFPAAIAQADVAGRGEGLRLRSAACAAFAERLQPQRLTSVRR